MTSQQPLQGSCSCGRYTYVVMLPEDAQHHAQVHFRTDDDHRRSQAALLTAFLKVPLAWYSSSTISYFPDETHNSISRTFSPIEQPHSQRKFCGYCGTHLSYWTEEPREEQDYLHITLGSLRSRDLGILQDLELLPEDIGTRDVHERAAAARDDTAGSAIASGQAGSTTRTISGGRNGPMTWFEEMLDGSHLGRARKTRRGMGTSADGTTSVTWEFTEYGNDGDVTMTSAESSSKRKLEDVDDGNT